PLSAEMTLRVDTPDRTWPGLLTRLAMARRLTARRVSKAATARCVRGFLGGMLAGSARDLRAGEYPPHWRYLLCMAVEDCMPPVESPLVLPARFRHFFQCLVFGLILAGLAVGALLWGPYLWDVLTDQERFKTWIASYGVYAAVVFIAAQFVQVVIF